MRGVWRHRQSRFDLGRARGGRLTIGGQRSSGRLDDVEFATLEYVDWFKDLRPWIDFANAQNPIIEADVTGKEWAQLAVSGFIWLVLPLVIGVWRVLRAEVK